MILDCMKYWGLIFLWTIQILVKECQYFVTSNRPTWRNSPCILSQFHSCWLSWTTCCIKKTSIDCGWSASIILNLCPFWNVRKPDVCLSWGIHCGACMTDKALGESPHQHIKTEQCLSCRFVDHQMRGFGFWLANEEAAFYMTHASTSMGAETMELLLSSSDKVCCILLGTYSWFQKQSRFTV